MQSLDGDFNLHWATNGNVYVISGDQDANTTAKSTDSDKDGNQDADVDSSDATTAFADSKGFIIGDSHVRVLHGYTNELAAYKVSRIRLHIAEAMPKTSRVVALRTVREENGGSEFVAAQDTSGNALIPIACAYRDKHPKLFLAEDPVLGVQTLQNTPDIAGHDVTACGAVRFHRSGGHRPA